MLRVPKVDEEIPTKLWYSTSPKRRGYRNIYDLSDYDGRKLVESDTIHHIEFALEMGEPKYRSTVRRISAILGGDHEVSEVMESDSGPDSGTESEEPDSDAIEP